MIRRLAWIIFLASCLFANAAGQGVVKGRLFDIETSKPLPSANIIYGKGLGTVSGPNGEFIVITEPGTISISIRYVGYRPENRLVEVAENDTVYLEIGLEYEIAEIDQIVVSAGKIEQRISELTVSMNVIPSSFLSNSHTANASELMNKIPGIEVLDGQASIRGGSGFSYGAGSRVLALLDGLPIIAADAGNIRWQFLPMENISQVEVIKGASSVLYGSSALNGVINFRTVDPAPEPHTKSYIESGIYGKPKNRDWVWWDSPRIYSSASFSHGRKFGNTGISAGAYLLNDPGYRDLNENKLGRLNFKIRREDKKIPGLSYGATLNTGITRKTDFVLWENGWDGALRQDTSTANQMIGHLLTFDPVIRYEKKGKFRHDLLTRIQSTKNKFPEGGQTDSRSTTLLAEYQSRYYPFKWLEINFGAAETFNQIHSSFYGDHRSLNVAAYSQADITPFERLKLVSGIRLEQYVLNGAKDKLVPLFRAGLNYRIRGYSFFRASFGQGYRFPSIAEKYAATTLGTVRIVPNPYVQAESGWNTEAGIKQGIQYREWSGFIDLAAFLIRNVDMIEYLFGIYPVPGEDSYSYGFMATNVENSRVYGTELSFSMNRKSERLKFLTGGGYTFVYPVEFNPVTGKNSDYFLKYRRKHSIRLNGSIAADRWDAGFDLSAGSKILNIDDVFLDELTRETILPGFYDYWQKGNDGFLVIDPHFGYSFTQQIRISLVVKNVLNTEYIGRPGDIMPHRNFSLRFSGEF